LQAGAADGNDGILFKNSAGTQKGVILFDTDNDYMLFSTNDTERMRIDSSGKVGIGTSSPQNNFHVSSTISTPAKIQSSGNNSVYVRFQNDDNEHGYLGYETKRIAIYASNTGGTGAERIAGFDVDGLKFGSDTAAANALDDYEEGSWTPDLRFGGGTTGISYSGRYGKYVKIGRLVWVNCRVALSNKGSNTGNAQVFGLPYSTSTESSTHLTPGAIWFTDASVQGSPQQTTIRTDGNNQGFIEFKNLTTSNEDTFDHSDVNNNFQFAFQLTYLSQ